ncbi:MAG TPA: tryptophan synthase subunit alpha, partial [Acidiphilium sp.]|nr:tryptophan synthase subunit alpha [Acidiphilium sp.]
TASAEDLARDIPRVRKATDLPIAVGFGVRTPAQAATVARFADAAVVASALIDKLAAGLDAEGKAPPAIVEAVLDDVAALAAAVRSERRAA